MKKAYFLFAVHNHQPVGNFEHVFEEGWKRCYGPFLEVLRRHPGVRCSLHWSGPLLEWLEGRRPEALAGIGELAGKGQVELLGGGFYEPILPSIPPEDALGQLSLMSDYLRGRFGKAPEGMWLAERVWEPHLAGLIAGAGLSYTLVDDTHFVYAGMEREELRGYYITEDAGRTLAVFPINKQLRYLVPFSEPRAAVDYLRGLVEKHPGCCVTLGDDGEKFGMWPGTHKWVYEERYLERFFGLLEENADWLIMLPMGEYLRKFPPSGRVYLPTASYDEMMEWVLPPPVQRSFEQILGELKRGGQLDRYSRFMRGGFWRNFLVKYPESNLQRAKAAHVSRKVRQHCPEDIEAKKALWRSQCNCAYWHGLFGGVYLNYLRHANYRNMLAAESAADAAAHREAGWVEAERFDYDGDGREELLLGSATVNALIAPGYGGALFELDYRPRCFNLSNTMSRREEAYHAGMLEKAAGGEGAAGAPRSIHDMPKKASRELLEALHYDWYLRWSFLDHFLGAGTTLQSFARCEYAELGGFVNQPYEIGGWGSGEGSAGAGLRRRGVYNAPSGRRRLDIDKSYTLGGNGALEVRYKIGNPEGGPLDLWMGIELNMTLLAGNLKERHLSLGGPKPLTRKAGSRGEADGVSSFELVNEHDRFAVRVAWSEPGGVWHFPLETVSQSEKGFDLSYQGTVLLPHFRFTLPEGGTRELAFDIAFREL